MLSLPLGQHILDYEPPRVFVITVFATFDGYVDPYDHMLHYNEAMILNVGNDRLLCIGGIRIVVSFFGAAKEEHQLLTDYSQVGKRDYSRLHKEVRENRLADRVV